MNERDELAGIIDDRWHGYGYNPQGAAAAILAAGYRKLVLDDATVERAARAVHDFLNKNYPCGCGPDEMCPGNSYEATHIARIVLAAAVKEEQA